MTYGQSLTPWFHEPWQLPRMTEGLDPQKAASAVGAPLPSSGEFAVNGGVPPMSAAPPSSPEASGQVGPLPDYMAGINQAFADNQALAQQQPQKRKFDVGKFLLSWAGHLGDNLTGNPVYSKQLLQRAEQENLERWYERKRQDEMADWQKKQRLPRPEQVGGTIGIFDPSTLSYNPVWQEPQPFEAYARSLGYQPGTNEYHEAIREYRAGTWNPAGVEGRLTVQAPRLEQSNTNNIRSTGTSRENNIRSNATTRRGQDITDARVRGSAGYQGRGRPGRGDLIGPIYQRGNKRVQYSKSAGGYVDLATGQKVN